MCNGFVLQVQEWIRISFCILGFFETQDGQAVYFPKLYGEQAACDVPHDSHHLLLAQHPVRVCEDQKGERR